jgi:hypothetical protein
MDMDNLEMLLRWGMGSEAINAVVGFILSKLQEESGFYQRLTSGQKWIVSAILPFLIPSVCAILLWFYGFEEFTRQGLLADATFSGLIAFLTSQGFHAARYMKRTG